MKKYLLGILLVLIITVTIVLFSFSMYKKNSEKKVDNMPVVNTVTTNKEEKSLTNEILITAVGDCNFGYDENFGYTNSFNHVFETKGADYFFGGVKSIFEKDDLTIVNYEGTFTDSTEKKDKIFTFKAPKEYAEILNNGNIEAVNLANNHSHDYYEVGYTDTINTLKNANVSYFGNDNYYIYKKNDIKIGLAGIFCIEDWNCTKKIDKAISDLKTKEVNNIILSFHWGIEKDYKQSTIQKYLGHYAIDHGADLVLGHHPMYYKALKNIMINILFIV